MARIAQQVMEAALAETGKAEALVIAMEPYLGKRYVTSAIYAYTAGRSTPPADVLLAAVTATGLSLDTLVAEASGAGPRTRPEERLIEVEHQLASVMDVLSRLQKTVEAQGQVIDRLAPRGRQPHGSSEATDERAAIGDQDVDPRGRSGLRSS
ncbi:MAG: hypothetical protein M3024_08735 [Candidatus Dormibacteraeota bacterium]|nr:hypothetical protein [Candidatus Dormibacteraeota bacterium]